MTARQENKEIYWAWKSMKQRCLNPKCPPYKNYGGRGITVCDEWMSFDPFLEWALNSDWSKGLDIDRIDNGRGYFPENCRWVSRRENINNRRVTITLSIDGITRAGTEWADLIGANRSVIKMWLRLHGEEETVRRIKEAMNNGYWKNDFGHGNRKAVFHEESGKSFDSVRSAAKYFGLAPCTISNALRDRNGKTSMGRFTWEEVT